MQAYLINNFLNISLTINTARAYNKDKRNTAQSTRDRDKMNTSTKQDTATIQLHTAELQDAIKAADTARGKDNSLPLFTAYRVELADNKLQFITTDRYRLAVISIHLDELQAATLATSGLFDHGLTLDGAAVLAIGKIKTKAAALEVTFNTAGLVVTHDTGTITAPAIDSDFPKWRELIANLDKPESTSGNYNPRYLSEAAKACEIIGGKNTPLNITLRGNYPATLQATRDGLDAFIMLMPVRVAK